MVKKIRFIILMGIIIGVMFSLMGCKSSETKKYIGKGKELIEQGEYEKGLVTIEMALDDDSENAETISLKEMIMAYLDGKAAFQDNNLELAKDNIYKVNSEYGEYKHLKKDVEELRFDIDNAIKLREEINISIEKVNNLVKTKKYEEADKLIEEINLKELSDEQRGRTTELKTRVDTELMAIETVKKAEEVRRAEEAKKSVEVAKTITPVKAEQMVKEYLTKRGEYIPSIIQVDHEDGESYVVHCYDIVVDHTATSGWYYVNKKTGKITSMF